MEPLREQRWEIVPVAFLAAIGTTTPISRAVWVYGFAVRALAGAAADVDILAAPDGNGMVLAPVTLAAGETVRETLPAGGVFCSEGVSVRANAGSANGTLWISYADL